MAAHGKSYLPHKFAERLAVFRANAAFITKHNTEDTGFELGLNQFADLSFEEFSKTHLGLLPLGTNGSYQCALFLRLLVTSSRYHVFQDSNLHEAKLLWAAERAGPASVMLTRQCPRAWTG